MRHNINYAEYFEEKVIALSKYLTDNNLKAMILGISGGIDSTICAAICYEVSKRTGISLIGRSLPTKFNKEGETIAADLVGKAFCNDYKEVNLDLTYRKLAYDIAFQEGFLDNSGPFDFDKKLPKQTTLANGNIQARLRMIYLYNLASIHKGIVIDTDNLTEHNLGYFTIHGDQGDVNPIGDLWKTQIFELAEWLQLYYASEESNSSKVAALEASLQLKPTAGLGITNNDLEEIGAESYDQVDGILQEILAWKWLSKKRGDFPEGDLKEQREMFLDEQQMLDTPINVIINVVDRHFKSEFKRKQLPIVI